MNQPISVCVRLNNLNIISSESAEWDRLSVIAIVNSFLAFPTAALNALVIFAILTNRALSTPSFLLLASLATTDLLVGLIGQPIQVAMTLYYRDGQMESYCYTRTLASVVFVIGGGTSIMIVTVMAFDRYLAICLKTRYKFVVTVSRVKIVVSLIWILAFFLSSLPFFVSPLAASIFGAIGVLFCLIITVTFYVLLFIALKKHCAQITTQDDQNQAAPTIDIAKYKKLLKTMLMVLVFMIFCYTFMAGGLTIITNANKNRSTQWGLLTVVGMNSTFNPVIYICRMRELRRACFKIIRKYLTCGYQGSANFTNTEQLTNRSAKPSDCKPVVTDSAV